MSVTGENLRNRVGMHGPRFQRVGGGGGGLVTQSCPALVTLRTVARQAPLPTGFSRQGRWSRLPLPSPGASFRLRD